MCFVGPLQGNENLTRSWFILKISVCPKKKNPVFCTAKIGFENKLKLITFTILQSQTKYFVLSVVLRPIVFNLLFDVALLSSFSSSVYRLKFRFQKHNTSFRKTNPCESLKNRLDATLSVQVCSESISRHTKERKQKKDR